MRRFAMLALLLVAAPTGATDLSGPLDGVLAAADGPFTVIADISVEAGAMLVIEPGCELRFAAGVGLDVHGTLDASGTAALPIVFAGDGAVWDGIDAFGASDCTLRHFALRDADTGLHVFDGQGLVEDGDVGPNLGNGLRIESDAVTVRRLDLHGSQAAGYTALFVWQASPLIEDCLVRDTPAAAGIGVWGPAAPTIAGGEVRGCLSGVTCVGASPTLDGVWIRDNGVAGNFDSGAGVYVGYAGGEPLVRNCVIEGNCFGVSVVLDGRANLGDVDDADPDDDGLNRFVGNDRYDGANRHVWNGTASELPAQNCFWAAADGVFVTDPLVVDGWIVDDDEGEGAAVRFEPLAEITAVTATPALARWGVWPNPANPSFTVSGELPGSGRLALRLFTPAGRLAAELWEGAAAAGPFSLSVRADALPSGLYLIRGRLDGLPVAQGRVLILR